MHVASGWKQEWSKYWYLPLLAALGYATSTMYVYSLGPFIAPIQEELGWSRAQISLGVTITSGLAGLTSIPVGMLIDRVGPRRVGVLGLLCVCVALSMLSTATGTRFNWILLWCGMALATMLVQAMVWTSAVNSRFVASRGLALAVTLSGASFAAAVFPVVAAWLIETYSWRTAFAVMGGTWGLIVVPLMALFFRGAQDRKTAPDTAAEADSEEHSVLHGLSVEDGIRSSALYKLVAAGGFFSFTMIGMVVHFVPILGDRGMSTIEAAGVASLIGIFSLIGRLGTGFLLDRFPAYNVGGIAFLIPLIGCALLLMDGGSAFSYSIAAAAIGLTLGAEVDVIAFLAAKYFGMKNFGALYGAMTSALCLGTAFGPLVAGALYDNTGSYNIFIYIVAALMATSAVLLFSLRSTPTAEEFLLEKEQQLDVASHAASAT